jgi:putative transposase
LSGEDESNLLLTFKAGLSVASEDEALRELDQVDEKWLVKRPLITRSWRQNWDNLNTLLNYPLEISKVIKKR